MRLFALTLALMAAPAGNLEAQGNRRTCSVDSASFARVASTGVHRNCDVDEPAKLRTPPDPAYSVPRGVLCVAVTLEFVVDSMGQVDSTTTLVVETNDRGFAAAVVRTLARWRYEPAVLQGKRVSQIVRERRTAQTKLGLTVRAGEPPPLSASAPCR